VAGRSGGFGGRRSGGGSSGRRHGSLGSGRSRKQKSPEEAASPDAARVKAIGLLARRDFASKELKGRLAQAGFDSGAAETAVTELAEERLVDDARYVEAAVLSRVAKGQGPVRIALELKRLGISPDLIEPAVDAKSPDWADRAAALRERRFGRALPDDPRERARQVRFLLYRGYSMTHVRTALGRVVDDLDEADLEAGEADGDDG